MNIVASSMTWPLPELFLCLCPLKKQKQQQQQSNFNPLSRSRLSNVTVWKNLRQTVGSIEHSGG